MKTVLLTVAALALSAGVAFADDPYFEDTSDGPDYGTQQVDTNDTGEPATDYTATSDIRPAPFAEKALGGRVIGGYVQAPADNPAARRFGDASPPNGQDNY
jgi:hypothetical protein